MRTLIRNTGIPFLRTLCILCTRIDAARAECPGTCGDVNANGAVTSADYIEMLHWVYGASPPAAAIDCADIDDYQGVTIRDAVWFIDCLFKCGSFIFWCPGASGPYVPAPTTDFTVVYNDVFPAGDSTVVLQIALVHKQSLGGVTLPLRVRVGGEVPLIGEVETGPDAIWNFHTGLSDVPGAAPGHLLLGYHRFYNTAMPTGSDVIARTALSMPPSAVDRSISVEWTPLPPDNVPIVVSSEWNYDGFEPRLFGCPILTTGDGNADGIISTADILFAVDYLWKSHLPPEPCAAVLDVDCSRSVTAADALVLINHVFKGGPPPCNVCELVGEGLWSCP